MTTGAVLLDSDTLSEIIKGRDFDSRRRKEYLVRHEVGVPVLAASVPP